MKALLSSLIGLILACWVGQVIADLTGFDPTTVKITCVILAMIPQPQGVLMAGVFKEIFIAKLMERFYAVPNFLSAAQDMTEFVEFNTINIADIGLDPAVLINNTAFPIPVATRTDTPFQIPLDNFDTENTVVRNLEEVETAYNKLESVVSQHRNVLIEKTGDKAAHAYSPISDNAFQPVLSTTGPDNGSGFKRLLKADVARLKKAWDLLKIPMQGRWLTLTPQHVEDLILEDADLFKVFANIQEGTIIKIFGFNIFEYPSTAIYNKNTGVKAAFGAAPDANDTVSSFAFHTMRVMKADGTIEMFDRLNDPEERGDILGFQKRFIALPLVEKFNSAIFSAAVS